VNKTDNVQFARDPDMIDIILVFLMLISSGLPSYHRTDNTASLSTESLGNRPISGAYQDIKDLRKGSKTAVYSIGEKLSFKIRYGIIKAGRAEMSVLSLQERNNRRIFHIQTTANSLSSFNWIYKVEDVVNTFVDAENLFPVRFEKKLSEGGYKADTFVDFLRQDSLAIVEFVRYEDDQKVKSRKKYNVQIPPDAFDVLSAFYYVRTLSLEPGQSVFLTNHEKDKIYNLEIRVHKTEEIKAEAGRFRCLLVEPLLQGEGIFKQKGRLKIWLTDDPYKIPVLMTSEILVGHITTELVKIEGLPAFIPSRIK
jgi:hypothetical protein